MDNDETSPATLNMDCFRISKATEELPFSVPQAGPLVRRLLRVAGRVLIDAGGATAPAETWPNTEGMVLQWLQEALAPLGYGIEPLPGAGREPLGDPGADW